MNNSKSPILIVEDDEDMAQLNARLLKRQGYNALVAHTAAEARLLLNRSMPDLIVLDIELPDGDGFSLCKEFQQVTDAPVLFLTGKAETKDKVTGLTAGGDYYLTKPYDRDEFLAVVQRLLSRAEQTKKKLAETSVITRGPLTLKILESKAYVNGRDAELTQKEFAVLLMLMRNEGKELTSEAIYKSIWGADLNLDTGIIRVNISRLKKKLDEENTDSFSILHEHGKGYILSIY